MYILDLNKPTIGVDVDLTTLRSDINWWNWLKNMAHYNNLPDNIEEHIENGHKLQYDLSTHFPQMKNNNVHPMDFWRQEGVYDTIQPVDGAVRAIHCLMDKYNIVFVTHNKGNGGRSKYNNLDRLFGRDNFGYVVTKEKYLLKLDYLIDDRHSFLNRCHLYGITPIKIYTPFIQEEDAEEHIIEKRNWNDILNHFGINFHDR